jgi:hypothetical protein
MSAAVARAALRNMVTRTAQQARGEAGFFAGLREAGVLVRLRFSQACPGEVTGYAVSLPGHCGREGATVWYGGGRLAAGLTLPRLRRGWDPSPNAAERSGAFRFTVPEQNAIFEHAARQATLAAEQIRHAAHIDPAAAADAAWAAADVLHVAATALRSPDLRCAADSHDRAARARYGRMPPATSTGRQLRAAARLMAMTGQLTGDTTLIAMALAALTVAVAQLRQAQQHAAQAAAAGVTATRLATCPADPGPRKHQERRRRALTAAGIARGDFPAPPTACSFCAARSPAPGTRSATQAS